MEFTTIKDVELVSVGMKWPSANGDITFTFDHLRDAMVAANDDPHVVPPRLKIGHADPRFADPEDPGHDPFYDGEPALGSVRNLYLANEGATLMGDYVYVPRWLAEMLPTAYPSRSIEGAWMAGEGPLGEVTGSWNVKTPGGKRYSFVLTACALLGVTRPAVQDLEDLRLFLTEGDGVVVAGTAPEGAAPVASIGDVTAPAKAAADIDKVVEVFCDEWCTDEHLYWWPRSLWMDPNMIIADDNEGGLWSVPVITDEDQNVSFGEPARKLQVYVDAPASAHAVRAAATMAGISADANPVKVWASREESPARSRENGAADGGASLSRSVFDMDVNEKRRIALAAALDLSEDATEEDITAALDGDPEQEKESGNEGDDHPATTPPAETPAEQPATEPAREGDQPAEQPATASADETTVAVDRGVWEESQRTLAALAAKDAKAEADRRRAALDLAQREGKIMASTRESWDRKMNLNPEATLAEIASLPKGLVPTVEVGHAREVELGENAEADGAMAAFFGSDYAQEAV